MVSVGRLCQVCRHWFCAPCCQYLADVYGVHRSSSPASQRGRPLESCRMCFSFVENLKWHAVPPPACLTSLQAKVAAVHASIIHRVLKLGAMVEHLEGLSEMVDCAMLSGPSFTEAMASNERAKQDMERVLADTAAAGGAADEAVRAAQETPPGLAPSDVLIMGELVKYGRQRVAWLKLRRRRAMDKARRMTMMPF